jgi:plasmid stability protein
VNIDDHVLAEAKVVAARSHRSLGAVIEDALRFSLANGASSVRVNRRVELPAHGQSGLQPGIDLADKEQIAAILDDGAPFRSDS